MQGHCESAPGTASAPLAPGWGCQGLGVLSCACPPANGEQATQTRMGWGLQGRWESLLQLPPSLSAWSPRQLCRELGCPGGALACLPTFAGTSPTFQPSVLGTSHNVLRVETGPLGPLFCSVLQFSRVSCVLRGDDGIRSLCPWKLPSLSRGGGASVGILDLQAPAPGVAPLFLSPGLTGQGWSAGWQGTLRHPVPLCHPSRKHAPGSGKRTGHTERRAG